MWQRDAERKLKKLAKGNYHSITKENNFFGSGKSERKIRLYIGNEYRPIASGEGKSFEEAFEQIEKEVSKYGL